MLLNIAIMQVFRPFALRGLKVCFVQWWSYLWRTTSSWLGEAQKCTEAQLNQLVLK